MSSMTARSPKKGSAWCQRQAKDIYVKQAKQEGWRSRAAYKLLQLQKKDRLFKPGMKIVDLGAAPGGWSQVLANCLEGRADGKIWALDLLEMSSVPGVTFLQGDFTEDDCFSSLKKSLNGQKLDWVVSDMAPNMSGIKVADQAKSMYLAELVSDFANQFLARGGGMLIKVFQGAGLQELEQSIRRYYNQVIYRKPDASRLESREVYLLCRGFKGSHVE